VANGAAQDFVWIIIWTSNAYFLNINDRDHPIAISGQINCPSLDDVYIRKNLDVRTCGVLFSKINFHSKF
jgi:hypothetical protein